jgi:hypothetical protein
MGIRAFAGRSLTTISQAGAGAVVAACALFLGVVRAQAQTCTLKCILLKSTLPSYIERPNKYLWFSAWPEQEGSCVSAHGRWDLGDGSTADTDTAQHQYKQAGQYTATYTASESGGASCTTTVSVTIVPATCDLVGGGLSVVSNDPATRTVSLRVDGTVTDCGGLAITETRWDWGDGVYGEWHSGVAASHTYASGGRYNAYALSFLGAETSFVRFGNSLWTDVVGRQCLMVGTLELCADTRQQNGDTYTFTGDVRINDILRFSGPVTYRGTPAAGTGDLFTDATTTVATAPDATTILSGKNQWYLVDGVTSPGRLTPQAAVSTTELGLKLEKVPLHLGDSVITVAGGFVSIAPTLFIGTATKLHLASLRLPITLQPGQQPVILNPQIIDGDGAPGISVEKLDSLTYDWNTKKLSGSIDVGFPFLKVNQYDNPTNLRYDLVVEPLTAGANCINSLDSTITEYDGIRAQLRTGERPRVDLAGTAVTNICDPTAFAPLFRGNLLFSLNGQGEHLGVPHATLVYRPPSTFSLLQGAPSLVLHHVTDVEKGQRWGFMALGGPVESLFLGGGYGSGGGANGRDIVKGTLALGALAWPPYDYGDDTVWHAYGSLTGTLTVDQQCQCDPSDDAACTLARTQLLALYSGQAFANRKFDVSASGYGIRPSSLVTFLGNNVLRDFGKLAIRVDRSRDTLSGTIHVTCSFAANLAQRPSAGPGTPAALRAAALERSATFTATEEPALFGCIGKSGTLPSVYLWNPSGQLITPATAGRLPGVTYAADSDEHAATFMVASAAPGTWTLGVDNLGENEVSCSILTVQPPSVVAFTHVTQTGPGISIALSVTPAAATTMVSLFYAHLADGIPEGEIAADLAAETGSLSATWDTADLPTGSYFVFARTDDGYNPPITTIHQPAIEVVNGALLPPTAVAATRSMETATLTWTPSLSGEVIGYTVLYTDAPDTPGYPFSAAAPLPTGATLSGLSRSRAYRFCVVAYDLEGNLSPQSSAVMLGPTVRLRRIASR